MVFHTKARQHVKNKRLQSAHQTMRHMRHTFSSQGSVILSSRWVEWLWLPWMTTQKQCFPVPNGTAAHINCDNGYESTWYESQVNSLHGKRQRLGIACSDEELLASDSCWERQSVFFRKVSPEDALANVPICIHILVAVSGSCGRSGQSGKQELEEKEWKMDLI